MKGVIGNGASSSILATLYAAIYGLLVSEDNALLLGSLLLFGVLAIVMIVTRKIDWYARTSDLTQVKATPFPASEDYSASDIARPETIIREFSTRQQIGRSKVIEIDALTALRRDPTPQMKIHCYDNCTVTQRR